MALGDFHTLALASGCNCYDPVRDYRCLGQLDCNGGSDLYAWGLNMHGQVNGIVPGITGEKDKPQQSVLEP